MRLSRLRADWERLGQSDAHWAVLSDPGKRGGVWNAEEFYASGRDEISYVMSYVDAVYPGLARHDALDFGSGPGRLTYALGEHFDHVVGVDVSAAMIARAMERDRESAHVTFVLNDRPDLALFDDGSFDFVYSRIVLQHIPPHIARGYVREFIRVVRPGGLALFQVPDGRPTPLAHVRREIAYRLKGRRDDASRIRIFGVPRTTVEADIRGAGGQLLHVAPDHSVPAWDSWLYAVSRGNGPAGPLRGEPPPWVTPR